MRNQSCLQTQCSQQRSGAEDAAIVPIRASNLGFRPETSTNTKSARDEANTLDDASKEGNDIHRCHHRRPGRSRAKFSSALRPSPRLHGIGSTAKKPHTAATTALAEVAA